MPEKFQRVVPHPEETAPDMGTTVVEPIQPPEPEQAAPQPQAPQPVGNMQQQQMPQTISIPTQQFIQMQQQLAASKELKPVPPEAQTHELSKRCAAPAVGHQIETRAIVQTQNIAKDQFVEVHQTLVLCVRCGASLAQIRGSLGM